MSPMRQLVGQGGSRPGWTTGVRTLCPSFGQGPAVQAAAHQGESQPLIPGNRLGRSGVAGGPARDLGSAALSR